MRTVEHRPWAGLKPFSGRGLIAAVVIGASLLLAGGNFLAILLPFDAVFVHPHYYDPIMPIVVKHGLGFSWQDLITLFEFKTPGEYRPRFLAFAIELVDQRVVLALYPHLLSYPTFSFAWIGQLLLGPYLLFRFVQNVTSSRAAAIAGVAVYVSSIGFLSGFTMLLLSGKALSTVVFIAALYLASELALRAAPGQLLWEVRSPLRWVLLGTILAGLLLDEVPIFAVLLVPVVFRELFLQHVNGWRAARRVAVNAAAWLAPVVMFLVLVIVVAPVISQRYLGYRFDYLGTVFANGAEQAAGQKSLLEGPYASFGPAALWDNFSSLFGVSLLPWQVSPLTKSALGDFYDAQLTNWPKLVVFALFFGLVGWLAFRRAPAWTPLFRRLLVVTGLFVIFHTMLSARHVPLTTGYYYGSSASLFMALLVALAVGASGSWHWRWRSLLLLLVPIVVVVQAVNFRPINDAYIALHNERMAKPAYDKTIPVAADQQRVTFGELEAIRQAWSRGQLSTYLDGHPVSTGAIYLVAELRQIDKANQATAN